MEVAGGQPLTLVRRLANGFRDAGVDFCHWKSNEAIALSEAGINDLDLLVAEEHAGTARQILEDLGFIRADVPPARRVPGLTDYFGLDPGSTRLVQVQLHERLILGDDMTKNYHLPAESALLMSARVDGVLPVPDPSVEYVVFVLRMALKHCPLDGVLMGKGRLTRTERRELEYLEDRLDPDALEQVMNAEFPWLGLDALGDLRPGLEPDASVYTRMAVGRRVMRIMAPFRRRPRHVDFALRVGRRLSRRFSPGTAPGAGSGFKTPGHGGGVIAFIGGDGAGKSTAVDAVFEVLAGQFRVVSIHMGKPPRSVLSRFARRLVRAAGLDVSAQPTWSTFPDGYPGPGYPLLNVMLARDRRRLARRARSMADAGWVVLSDRYPIPELVTMDSPRNARIAERFPGWYIQLMTRIEARYYNALPKPDVRLVFRVPAELAVSRRSEQDPEFVSVRAREVTEVDWDGAVVITAEASEEEVHGQTMDAVWHFLAHREGRTREK